jgi:hypothetical protein
VKRPFYFSRRTSWQSANKHYKLTIIDGDPGLGKSLLMLDLAARLSMGQSWPGGSAATEPANTIYLTAEDSDDVLVPRLRVLGADLNRVFFYRSKDRLLQQPLSFPPTSAFWMAPWPRPAPGWWSSTRLSRFSIPTSSPAVTKAFVASSIRWRNWPRGTNVPSS